VNHTRVNRAKTLLKEYRPAAARMRKAMDAPGCKETPVFWHEPKCRRLKNAQFPAAWRGG